MESQTRPNVLLLMTDQQRFDALGCAGNSDIATPHLDRLAARGVRFERAYSTTPVCVPARYTLQSGSDATRTDVYDNSVPTGGHDRMAAELGPFLPQTMRDRGYRTFGVGKFHTVPWDADLGFDDHLHSEGIYLTPDQRERDAYVAWLTREHPGHAWVEGLVGEKSEMYYMPQMRALPAEVTSEHWTTDHAIELIARDDDRPWYGHVSFYGPHPPFAPPIPFNRAYDPDRMPSPVVGDIDVDHLDQQIPWMNHAVFAEDVDDLRARSLKARYYGEITYIDQCIGRLLDAVEALPDSDNTLILFFSDHGDLLGDHHGWQKESFFEASTRIPFLASWPAQLPQGVVDEDSLVSLTDVFAIVTGASGQSEPRQGVDVLASVQDGTAPRPTLFGYHGRPGTNQFKAMVRNGHHKLIWMANGGHSLLFDVQEDPLELAPLQDAHPERAAQLRQELKDELMSEGVEAAFENGELRTFAYEVWPRRRIYQFERGLGIFGFPEKPLDVLNTP